ncbi:hypothetical protein [Sphingobacterium tabacisoli]|uniref:Phosphoenolpyruvate carboxykinase n=1 Tax=Sphingobacterium tabacisoli TaxID=2044855 RepID=A0ABW5LB54_9SPHI|nr:hypothetical protein [Sphingobacterium tabacisoli]
MKIIEGHSVVDIAVAGHGIRLAMPEHYDLLACLPNFSAFIVDSLKESEVLMEVMLLEGDRPVLKGDRKILTDISSAWENKFSLEELEEGYLVSIEGANKGTAWQMLASKDFYQITIYALGDELYNTTVLNWFLMMAYGQAILQQDSVMIHASVVERKAEAYAFLGKSGTGKSTHSGLWLQHIEGVSLLNDDNPVVRLEGSEIYIYGTPWSGKMKCYINKGIKLGAIVRLRQAEENRMRWIDGIHALTALMPSCTAMRWNMGLFNAMIGTAEKIIRSLPIGELACLPNAEAALLCHYEIIEHTYKTTSINLLKT